MNSLSKTGINPMRRSQQRGVVLFFALVALLAMSLAAVALIRSVDTGTLIAGNLSFKRAATSSADAGIEAAITWMVATDIANNGLDPYMNLTHPFNHDGGAGAFLNAGYYSSINPALSLTDGTGIQWTDADSRLVSAVADASGNQTRYVIQRMSRYANSLLTQDALFSGALQSTSGQQVLTSSNVCNGPGCSAPEQSPMYRITSRTTGPKLTISYVQAFVY